MSIKLLCIDADDTLWHDHVHFEAVIAELRRILSPFLSWSDLERRLVDVEAQVLPIYGYGVKSFVLSIMEAALRVASMDIPNRTQLDVLGLARSMVNRPVDVIEGVPEALADLANRARLLLLTKGDILHQEIKLEASRLSRFFFGIEIVGEKSERTYKRVAQRNGLEPFEIMMVGNSVKSDILPALAAGAYAALIPHPMAWSNELAQVPSSAERFKIFERLQDVGPWLGEIR